MLFHNNIRFDRRIDDKTPMSEFIVMDSENDLVECFMIKDRKPHLFTIKWSETEITIEYNKLNIDLISKNIAHVKAVIALQAFAHLEAAHDGKQRSVERLDHFLECSSIFKQFERLGKPFEDA